MAFDGDSPIGKVPGGPVQNPPSIIPGPSNPWASCSGGGGGGGGGGGLPDSPEQGGMTVVDVPLYHQGQRLLFVAGVFLIIAMFLLAFVLLSVELAAAAALGAAAALILLGVLASGLGSASIISAIDPLVIDYKKRVLPCTLRQVSLSEDAPKPLISMLHNFCELEQLSTGEIDILDRARAAAGANDSEYYDSHLRDLFDVQSRKKYFAKQAADDMRTFLKESSGFLSKIDNKVEFKGPLRDAVNPITELRHDLIDMGVTASEINSYLYFARVPSEQLSIVEKNIKTTLKKTNGDITQTLLQLADDLESIEWLSKDAFYE